MRRIILKTQAFKDAEVLSLEYFKGRMDLEMFRLHLIKCIINFSPEELRAMADVFIDVPSGEG